MCSQIFSKIPKYKISWKSVQWFLSCYTQVDMAKLTDNFCCLLFLNVLEKTKWKQTDVQQLIHRSVSLIFSLARTVFEITLCQ
jgi:hypothetical protein